MPGLGATVGSLALLVPVGWLHLWTVRIGSAARTAIAMGVPVVISFLGDFDMSAKLKLPPRLLSL